MCRKHFRVAVRMLAASSTSCCLFLGNWAFLTSAFSFSSLTFSNCFFASLNFLISLKYKQNKQPFSGMSSAVWNQLCQGQPPIRGPRTQFHRSPSEHISVFQGLAFNPYILCPPQDQTRTHSTTTGAPWSQNLSVLERRHKAGTEARLKGKDNNVQDNEVN